MIEHLSKASQKFLLLSALVATALLLSPLAAQAHTGFYQMTGGLLAGAEHPLTGADHILAMVAVGLWAVQLGGQALWLLPAVFVTSMIGGGVAGSYGLSLPGSEQLIALSIFLLGAAIFSKFRLQLWPIAGLVGLFAVAHGFAHGVEMPHSANVASYVLGFTLVTAVLHGAGVVMALAIEKYASKEVLRYTGIALLLGGLGVVAKVI
jgi:urease accessory protein